MVASPVLGDAADRPVRRPAERELEGPVRILPGTPKLERYRSSRLVDRSSCLTRLQLIGFGLRASCGGADVDRLALEAAQRIASLSPEAVLAARRMMKGTPEAVIARIDEEADFYREHLGSPAARAAFEAFFARKK